MALWEVLAMDKFMLFVSAVVAHWMVTFGGVAMVIIGLIERYKHKETTKWIFWGSAAVLLLVAFYQAWSDEHSNTQAVIAEKAQAVGSLGVCNGDLKSANAQNSLLQSQVVSQQGIIDKYGQRKRSHRTTWTQLATSHSQ